jgi:hypothetical protein
VPARTASSSWLTRRRVRHVRKAPASPPLADSVIILPVYRVPRRLAIPSGELSRRVRRRTVVVATIIHDRRITMADVDLKNLTDRYVAVWSEPDPERRRAAVRELWSTDGVHVLQPPQEMREAAEGLGFDRLVLEARGHDELEVRVTRSYEEFIAPGTFVFRSRGDAERLHDVVKFHWEMVPRDGGDVAGVGLEILVLGADGRIVSDYQFIEG